MTLPAVYYSAEFDAIVLVGEDRLDYRSLRFYKPVEWGKWDITVHGLRADAYEKALEKYESVCASSTKAGGDWAARDVLAKHKRPSGGDEG